MNLKIEELDLVLTDIGDVETSDYPEDGVAIALFSDDGVIREWGNFPEWANATGAVDSERFKRAVAWLTGDSSIEAEGIARKYNIRIT